MSDIEKINKTLFGNGRAGLCERIDKMEVYQKEMYKDVGRLADSFSALSKSVLEIDVNEKAKIKLKEARFKTIKSVSAIVSIAGVIGTVLIKIL